MERYAGIPLPALYRLMDALGLVYEKRPASIVAATQAAWLRIGERWETPGLFEEKKAELRSYFQALDMIDPWLPKHKQFDGVLFLGTVVGDMYKQLQFLRRLVGDGVEFPTIVVLTGQRFITDQEKELLLSLGASSVGIQMETDAARFLCGLSENKQLMYSTNIQFVDTPETVLKDGTRQRPTTADTVTQWLQEGAQLGHYLAISHQPVCNYQRVVLETVLSKTFTVEVAGVGDDYQERVAVYLDTIARTLYQQFNSSV